jgi:hypothetical protein
MKSWKLMVLCSAVSLAACQGTSEPPRWSDIQGKPEGFNDDEDDVRSDEEVRAIAHDEVTRVVDASPASHITAEQVASWDAQVATGDHRSAGYLTAETDPKLGTLSAGAVPVWNGTSLRDGALHEVNGKVGVGTDSPSTLLTVSTLAKFGTPFTSDTTRSCSMSGSTRTNSSPSDSACTTYCTSRGFASGAVSTTGNRSCGGASCDYISDFETCTTATMQNNGNCNSCASAFVCTCQTSGTELNGAVRMMNGNVGIGVETPNSPLQVSGYLQLAPTAGMPPAADCDSANERGRMMVDPTSGVLWVCVNAGWVSK